MEYEDVISAFDDHPQLSNISVRVIYDLTSEGDRSTDFVVLYHKVFDITGELIGVRAEIDDNDGQWQLDMLVDDIGEALKDYRVITDDDIEPEPLPVCCWDIEDYFDYDPDEEDEIFN